MPTRRRPHSYHVEADVTPSASSSWMTMLGNNVPLTVVLSLIVGGAVWYGTTNTGNAQRDAEIAALKNKIEQQAPAIAAKMDSEAQQRTAIRNEFMANANKTTEILGSIASRLAVSETKQEATNKALDTTNSTLSKIADQLQQLNSRGSVTGR